MSIYIPIKKLNKTTNAVQSYRAISKAVQTVRCKAYLLNPDKYGVLPLTGYIRNIILHQMSFSNLKKITQPARCNNS